MAGDRAGLLLFLWFAPSSYCSSQLFCSVCSSLLFVLLQWRKASFELFALRSGALQDQVDQLGRLANDDLIRVLDEDLLTSTELSTAARAQGRRQLALDLVQQESRLEYNRGVLPATLFRNVYERCRIDLQVSFLLLPSHFMRILLTI